MASEIFDIQIKGVLAIEQLMEKVAKSAIDPEKLLKEIGEFLMFRVKQRTSKGIDADGKPFKPYSAGHKAFRALKGLPTEVVDLFFTGSMMSSMTYDTMPKQLRVFFAPTPDKSGVMNPEKAFYLDQDREFFAASDEDQDRVADMADEFFGRVIRGS